MINYIKKMNPRKRNILVILFIVIDMAIVILFLSFRDAASLNKFRNEMDRMASINLSTGNYNRSIKSSGRYASVEKCIKDYLVKYTDGVEEVLGIINDPQLMGLLSYDNYSKDGPNFEQSIKYLNDTSDKYNKKIDELLSLLDEESIMNNIYSVTESPYYVSLYEKFMFRDEMVDQFNENKELLNNSKVKVNKILGTSLDVLNFLILYKDSWVVEDGEIKFKTDELCNYYKELISKLKV